MTIHNDLSTPYGTALFMMRRGADAGLIVAYLEHEARAAGVDPFDLSMYRLDPLHRGMRQIRASLAGTCEAIEGTFRSLKRSFRVMH